MKKYKISVALLLSLMATTGTFAQTTKKQSLENNISGHEAASNVLLNASDDSKPRDINVGLPIGTGGTPVYENGLVVTYDTNGQGTSATWRQDGSYQKVQSLTLSQTAIMNGVTGASVATYTNNGTDTFKGKVGFMTNSFGLLRGNVNVSGPLKKGFYYSLNTFVDMDPSNYRSKISRFLDETYLFKGAITKKYNGGNGEIGLIYKYINSKSASDKKSPYYYRKTGKVDPIEGMDISHDAYTLRSRTVTIMDPLTGKMVETDVLNDTGSETHDLQLFGNNKLANSWNLNYVLKYTHALAGDFSPNYNDIVNSSDAGEGYRYIYADNTNEQVYTGYVQRAMGSIRPRSLKQAVQTRVELKKDFIGNRLTLGFHGQYYNADKNTRATWSYMQEVADNPRPLVLQQLVNGKWANANNADAYGQWNYNGSLQYYNGHETKAAFYVIDNWDITRHLNVEAAVRLENHAISGDWYSKEKRDAAPDKRWLSGETEKVDRNFFNKSFSLSAIYKIQKSWGLLAEANYFEQGGYLSAYSGADNPQLKQSHTPYFSGGIYLNTKFISLVSKVSQIKMSNYSVNGTFNNDQGESLKKTFNYDVKTFGWTTDIILYPFKGFNLHFLLTLQNPKYDKFEFDVFGQQYNYKGNTLRSVSKTLIEIDPTYTWKKLKVWVSARYFGKQPANYPNSVYFASRWETFAGVEYKYSKNVSFSVNAVNLLNEVGAQGSISGGNTITDGSKYYNKPLTGTYIRPFTMEFKVNVTL